MKHQSFTPALKRLVLLGGGHSHLSVLMHLARKPLPGLDVTLVTREVDTPYSGALPAYLSGSSPAEELFIDLRPLTQMAGVRLIKADVESIDLQRRRLLCSGRPSVEFDMLSINIGSSPDIEQLPGALNYATGVKPISRFLQRWEQWQQDAAIANAAGRPFTLAVVGGGPASVELAFAVQYRLLKNASRELGHRDPLSLVKIILVSSAPTLLPGHGVSAQRKALQTLRRRAIDVRLNCRVIGIEQNQLHCTGHDGGNGNAETTEEAQVLAADGFVIATGASAPRWLKATGLALDEHGFLLVNQHLQSVSHPFVFGAGDIATIEGHPRPRSGVFAVRQGMPLARNLYGFASGKTLERHIPQKHALALLSTGDGSAIASRNDWSVQGRWVGLWKQWIDRRFVARYRNLPPPPAGEASLTRLSADAPLPAHSQSGIRCAGCAAKIGSTMLSDVLHDLVPCTHADILSAHLRTEDTAMIQIDSTRVMLQTVDHFRAFLNDPYLFSRIATVHCLSDIHAMGATAHSALAIVSIPYAAPAIMQAQLTELMTGCTEVLNAHNTALIGGHTGEAYELSFGLSITGFVDPQCILRKTGMQPGDQLILCKALGTGTLFAADMRYQARQRWIENAVNAMQQSNQLAAHCFTAHGATACTDITGFGLLGHLREMVEPQGSRVELTLSALPVLDGALECLERGLFSSLHAENSSHSVILARAFANPAMPRYQMLFDPQTSGGLLASVPEGQAAACVEALGTLGYRDAACIGRVLSGSEGRASVVVLE